MFDHLLDSSNKWSNIEFGEEIGIEEITICTLSGALITASKHMFHVQKYAWTSVG